MKARVTLERPAKRTAPPVPSSLPAIDLPPARILLPTPPVKPVEPGRPRKVLSPLGVAAGSREGLGPEEEDDGLGFLWVVLTLLGVGLELGLWC